MDPQTDLPDLVEDLEVNIDELSETLSPLLNKSLSTTASSLPLLDKAKLYVLAAYSVESLLYSSLQASGVNAKEHAVFKELARLKGYFAKIKQAEERMTAPAAPKAKLDVGAAARFIRHGLAGNDKYDLERAERMAKEKARAQLKARQINKKFDDNDDRKAATITPQKRPVEEAQPEQDDDGILEDLQDPAASPTTSPAASEPNTKKPRVAELEPMDIDSTSAASPPPSTSKKSKQKQPFKKKNQKNKAAKAAARAEAGLDIADNQNDTSNPATPSQHVITKRTTRSRKAKSVADETEEVEAAAGEVDAEAESPPAGRAPKTRSETGKGVVDGEEPGGKARKGRGRGKKAK